MALFGSVTHCLEALLALTCSVSRKNRHQKR
ncbi:hypothetical protein HCH_04110 [Hahella chejuensis KCTC 2396]|uniref:Uncharacterized protein n=1 Tax=Hahella chejuensis (strain KCTC 2396) TaxID=349521 RepID=Q2SEV4_HAHCH|nr:hypothetical protein HCH_04110 [Hahella chejuensis KCTC 2396]